MAKNPRPGFATQKQVAYLLRLLDESKRGCTPDEYLVIKDMTQDQIRAATTKAEILRAEVQGRPIPRWIKV